MWSELRCSCDSRIQQHVLQLSTVTGWKHCILMAGSILVHHLCHLKSMEISANWQLNRDGGLLRSQHYPKACILMMTPALLLMILFRTCIMPGLVGGAISLPGRVPGPFPTQICLHFWHCKQSPQVD